MLVLEQSGQIFAFLPRILLVPIAFFSPPPRSPTPPPPLVSRSLSLNLSLSLTHTLKHTQTACSLSPRCLHNRIVTKNNTNGWVGVIGYCGIPATTTTIRTKSASNHLIKHLDLPETLALNGEILRGLMHGLAFSFDSSECSFFCSVTAERPMHFDFIELSDTIAPNDQFVCELFADPQRDSDGTT